MSANFRSRRFALQLLTWGGGAALLAACGGNGGSSSVGVIPGGRSGFPQGVFSGDPTARSVVLSTRVVPEDGGSVVDVTLQIASDEGFTTILQEIPLTARRDSGEDYRTEPGDYIARTVVGQLPSAQTYFYRFITSVGITSPVGQFRTLPDEADGRPVRFLHISCANEPPFPIGAALLNEVNQGDVDFVLFNGDTVYADRFWLGQDPIGNLDFIAVSTGINGILSMLELNFLRFLAKPRW